MQDVAGGPRGTEADIDDAVAGGSAWKATRPAVHRGVWIADVIPSITQSKRVIADSVAAFDFVLIFLSAVLAKWIYIDFYLDNDQELTAYAVLAGIAAAIAVMSFRNQGVYDFDRLKAFRGQARRIVVGLAVSAMILLGVGYFLKVSASFSRGWMFQWLSFAFLFLICWRFLVSRLFRRWAAMGTFARTVAIYGSGDIAAALIDRLDFRGDGLRLVGIFDDLARGAKTKVRVTGGLSDLIRLGQAETVDEVILALPLAEDRRISGLLEQLSILPADIKLCPDMAAFRMRPLAVANYDGVAILEVARRPLDNWAPIVKACEDRLLAGLMLIVAAPILLLIAIAIKFDSRGPIFFAQRRHGFNHKIITVLKFRTMYVAEDGPVVPQATRNDHRVTRVGRFLRRTSLDELPQLLNVLRGEMSLVGPRPHALAHNEYYSALVESYANRHKMKPGITGWAQINGLRGETDTPEKMRRRVEYDLYYIENWSLWLDLKIILLTPFFGLVGRNAF
jgi:putative colanic acid biosynthesis UDP-glucose lipid carrier transferase